MVISPFDKNDIFALLVNDIADGVTFISLMLDHNFITRDVGTVDTDIEDVIAGQVAVHAEAVLPTYQGLFKTFAPGFNLQ